MCGRYLFSTQEYKEFRQIVRDAQRRSSGQHNELSSGTDCQRRQSRG